MTTPALWQSLGSHSSFSRKVEGAWLTLPDALRRGVASEGFNMTLDINRPDLSVAVVGTGAMGRGIAQVTAQGGMKAVMFDAVEGGAAKGSRAVGRGYQRVAEGGQDL